MSLIFLIVPAVYLLPIDVTVCTTSLPRLSVQASALPTTSYFNILVFILFFKFAGETKLFGSGLGILGPSGLFGSAIILAIITCPFSGLMTNLLSLKLAKPSAFAIISKSTADNCSPTGKSLLSNAILELYSVL